MYLLRVQFDIKQEVISSYLIILNVAAMEGVHPEWVPCLNCEAEEIKLYR